MKIIIIAIWRPHSWPTESETIATKKKKIKPKWCYLEQLVVSHKWTNDQMNRTGIVDRILFHSHFCVTHSMVAFTTYYTVNFHMPLANQWIRKWNNFFLLCMQYIDNPHMRVKTEEYLIFFFHYSFIQFVWSLLNKQPYSHTDVVFNIHCFNAEKNEIIMFFFW